MAGKSPGPEALRRSAERRLVEYAVDSETRRHNGTWCREWTKTRDKKGYGQMGYGWGNLVRVHRLAYELAYGPIPEGLVVDHLCRNPPCVNPLHLEAVTSRINTIRGETHAAVNLLKTHCPQGHEYTPENTYREGRSAGVVSADTCVISSSGPGRQTAASASPLPPPQVHCRLTRGGVTTAWASTQAGCLSGSS